MVILNSESFDQYLREISRYPLLNLDQEREYGRCAQAGDEEAVGALVRGNLRFVVSVAKKYQNRGLSLADLVSEGNAGLVTAARKFDPEQGVKFVSYAVWWIRQGILQALTEQTRPVRIPLNRGGELISHEYEVGRIMAEEGVPEPEARRIALNELPEAERKRMVQLSAWSGSVSLEDRIGEDSELSSREGMYDPMLESIEYKTMLERLDAAMDDAGIKPRDQKMFKQYNGLGDEEEMTLEQIGQLWGVTRERVRQINDRTRKKLRPYYAEDWSDLGYKAETEDSVKPSNAGAANRRAS